MTHIHLTTDDLMVYKDWKIDYHFLLITRIINCKVYDFTFFLSIIPPSHHLLLSFLEDCCKPAFLLYSLWAFDYYSLIKYFLLCEFIEAFCIYRDIFFKFDILYLRSLLPATTVTISCIFNFLNSIRFWKLSSLYLEKVIIIWIT